MGGQLTNKEKKLADRYFELLSMYDDEKRYPQSERDKFGLEMKKIWEEGSQKLKKYIDRVGEAMSYE